MVEARELAYEMTRRVESGGAYLNLLLRYGMTGKELDRRERSLVAELAYGIQRHRNKLDFVISSFSRQPPHRLQPEVLDLLRMGVYQLMEMRTPSHAAVNETVELAKRVLGQGAASYVNAVLRSAAEGLDGIGWPTALELPSYLEVVYSHPEWMVDRLIEELGGEEAEALCSIDNRIPALTLRTNTGLIEPLELAEAIRSLGGAATPSSRLEEALIEVELPREMLMDLLEGGRCLVQDEASMLVSHIVDPKTGSTVVDACAAPGGKTSHLAQLGGAGCRVIAVDRSGARLEALRRTRDRMNLGGIEIIEGDARGLKHLVEDIPDAVLVDAPCSGLGTLQRNPDLKWRTSPRDVAAMAEEQLEILEGCCGILKPGGILVYSVCTFTREETSIVLEAFMGRHPEFEPHPIAQLLPEDLRDGEEVPGRIQLMPHLHNTEGMFIARMIRT